MYVCMCVCAQSCLALCDPMYCSTPGFPVFHYLLEFAQIHVCWVGDAIQPSHPLLPSSPLPSVFPFLLSLFQWVQWVFLVTWLFTSGIPSIGALGLASVLPINIQGWFRLGLTGLISLLFKGLSRVFPNNTVQKHLLNSYINFILMNKQSKILEGKQKHKLKNILRY